MKYLLDANIFIEAYKRYYHNKIVSNFWQWLVKDEDIYTIQKIKDEIDDGNDELYTLIKNVKTLGNIQNIGQVANYVNQKYNQEETAKFLAKADPLLIATGINNAGVTVITNEVLVGNNSNKIKIPNVCKGLNVNYKNGIFDILKSKQIDLSSYTP